MPTARQFVSMVNLKTYQCAQVCASLGPLAWSLYGFMKKLLIIIVLLSGNAFADSWNSNLIKFSLEGGPKIETMLWISGYSYSATAFHHRCGSLEKTKYIESKYLIEKLNEVYAGKTITSEQASALLDETLAKDYPCKPYNKSLKSGTLQSAPLSSTVNQPLLRGLFLLM